jgi:hypothetical protein
MVPYSVQKNIKKAELNKVTIKKVEGTKDDIKVLQSMWYDPEDPNLPDELTENEFMFIAYDSSLQAIGAVILLTVGNHLFLNNLAGNESGKSLRVQDYLLWHCVNYFAKSKYKYIDVGVSYRHTLYDFFKKWQTISYPVIFNVPVIPYYISILPFVNTLYNSEISPDKIKQTIQILNHKLKGRKFTFLPNLEEAEKVLNRLNYNLKENSFNFLNDTSEEPFVIDLTKIFTVQFGVLVMNLHIDDKSLWNEHRALDIFKREFVYSTIASELEELDVVIAKRKRNIDSLDHLFELEGIKSAKITEAIPSAYYFTYHLNDKFHNKLTDFGIRHYYDNVTNEIGLPIHQNLTKFQFEYMYAIFRGVLNLCSEWVHTDIYSDLN